MIVTVSAPGKLVLFGEHAVVYGYPCIVTAMNQRIRVTLELINTPEFQLEAPDVKVMGYKKSLSEVGKGEIPKGALFVEMAIRNFPNLKRGGIKISTSSDFSAKLGFGSSSAATVCVIKALAELFARKFSEREIFDLAYKTVMDIQKKGSGVDVAAAVYGGTLYFVIGGKIIEPFSPPLLLGEGRGEVFLLVGYSGIKADTVSLLNQVKETFEGKENELKVIYDNIGNIAEKAKNALSDKDWKHSGELMNKNQLYLQQLDVSIPKLDSMITAAYKAGAYGAKLSGAGGGDCMIALAPEDKKQAVEHAIASVGGEVIHIRPNAEGVRVE